MARTNGIGTSGTSGTTPSTPLSPRLLTRRRVVTAAGAALALAAGSSLTRSAHAAGFSFFGSEVGELLGGLSSATGTTTTAPAAPASSDAASAVAPAPAARPLFLGDALPEPEVQTPSVPDMPWADDLSNVINVGDVYQAEATLACLRQMGFCQVIGQGGYEFFELYERNRYDLFPNFVTVDSMVHTYHLYFAYLLKKVERDRLLPLLGDLGQRMLQMSLAQLQALAGTEWEAAAQLNVGFFAVGTALLDPSAPALAQLPGSLPDVVAAELQLIADAAGITKSPLFGVDEDYSQYIPRGYYAESDALASYFHAMMWYGRRNFTQSSEMPDRAALLMTMALGSTGAPSAGSPGAEDASGDPAAAQDAAALAAGDPLVSADHAWDVIYEVTSFFVGASDDSGYYEYAPLLAAAYGPGATVADLPGNDAAWQRFHELTAQAPAPQINSVPVRDVGEDVDHLAENKGFRFMGQRFTLDATIFQQLIYNKVGERSDGAKRMLPDMLDVPAALGSQKAYDILAAQGDTTYPNYEENLAALRQGVAEAPATLWSGTLYAQWLNMLRPLLDPKGEGWPNVMRTEAWARRDLQVFGGSFAELKHDTVLYAKQAMAEAGGGPIEVRDDRGYVEPEPAVFGRLASLVQATAAGLSSFGLLDAADLDNLSILQQLSEALRTIANKELRAELLTDDEFELIRSFGVQLEHFWQAVHAEDAGDEYFTTMEFPAAIVTDIATDPNGSVLEIGTGAISTLYVIVPVDGTLRLASGPAYSFYQFAQPIDQRLTDGEWRQMLGIQHDYEGGMYDWKASMQVAANVVPWTQDFALSPLVLW